MDWEASRLADLIFVFVLRTRVTTRPNHGCQLLQGTAARTGNALCNALGGGRFPWASRHSRAAGGAFVPAGSSPRSLGRRSKGQSLCRLSLV
jgi:hypothetical protein